MNVVARAFYMFTEILIWAIIIRSFVIMFIRDMNNPIVRGLRMFTDPVLVPVRNMMYRIRGNPGMIDFSPLIAIILINILRQLILGILL